MNFFVSHFLIPLVVILGQHFLSEARHWFLGGILPTGTVLFTVWCFFFRTPRLGLNTLWAFAVLLLLLLWDWADGRRRFNQKKKAETEAELKKMRAHDLDE